MKKKIIYFLFLLGIDVSYEKNKVAREKVINSIANKNDSANIKMGSLFLMSLRFKEKALFLKLVIIIMGYRHWGSLKTILNYISYSKNHLLYENILNWYDKQMHIYSSKKTKAIFYGEGMGEGTLNSYRIIKQNHKLLFEKIYLNKHVDFKKIMWFIDNIDHNLDHNIIKTPEIIKISEGNYISSIYYQFVRYKSIPKEESLNRCIEISMYLFNISLPDYNNIPDEVFEYRNDDWYKAGINNIEKFFDEKSEKKLNFRQIESIIDKYSLQFAHGELFKHHLKNYNYVIDWDKCGIYPLGFDIAKNMAMYDNYYSIVDIESLLQFSCLEIIKNRKWNEFLSSFYYFFYVFRSTHAYKNDNLSSQLYAYLECLN